MLDWIARVKVPPCAKFGDPSSKGVGARGQKAEKQKCALRAHFCTLGAVRPHGTQVRPRPFWPESLGSRRPPVWAVAVLENFSKGLRGGTWRVTRGTLRHVTNAIVVPALWRIFWCLSRPDRLRRSGAIDENPWTHTLTEPPTNRPPGRPADFVLLTLHGRTSGNLHSENGLRPFSSFRF